MNATHAPGLVARLHAWWDAEDDPGAKAPTFEAGEFEIVAEPSGQRRFWFVCPGCRVLSPIALRPVVDGSPQSWQWNGSIEKPALAPSINHVGCWHGWLRDGVFAL